MVLVIIITATLIAYGLTAFFGRTPAGDAADHSQGEHVPSWLGDVITRHAPGTDMPFSLRVVVLADEEYIASAGYDWVSDARSAAKSGSNLVSQLGVDIEIVSVRSWDSSDSGSGLGVLLAEALEENGQPTDALLLVLTGQRFHERPDYDGWASAHVPATIIKASVPQRPTLGSLVAHEIGHLLGADHHEDGHECDEGGCILDYRGYAHGYRWCDDHKDMIAAALNSI